MSVDELKEHLNTLYDIIADSIVSGNHISVSDRALEILKNYKE